MNALEVLVLQQPLVTTHVPGYLAGIGLDLLVRWLGDEALLGLVEVALVVEGQRGRDAFAQFERERRRQITLRVEVLHLRWRKSHSGALGLRGSLVECERSKECNAGTRSDNQTWERLSGLHRTLLTAKMD